MYNRSEIMKAAWVKHNRFGMDMSTALRVAWLEAKDSAPIHEVWADGFRLDAPVRIGHGLTGNQARKLQYESKCDYDRLWIKAA